ncbi:MAG: hypothetical protein ACTSPB_00300 [Candidatus Thorarchaeota archaeon]
MDDYDTEYLRFWKEGLSDSGKTEIWWVLDRGDECLGKVRWFGRWRQYTFFPEMNTLYNNQCLSEVSEFLVNLNREHREKK